MKDGQIVYIVSNNKFWTEMVTSILTSIFEDFSFITDISTDNLKGLDQNSIVVIDEKSFNYQSLMQIIPTKRGGMWLIVNAKSMDQQYLANLIILGFYGFIDSHSTLEVLPRAIRCILSKQLWFSRETMALALKQLRALLVALTEESSQTTRVLNAKFSLSDREQQVLNHLLKGESNKEIAIKLNLSPCTIKCHVSSILYKTGKQKRGQLSMLFYENKNKTNKLTDEEHNDSALVLN